jgi:hypothetical protein
MHSASKHAAYAPKELTPLPRDNRVRLTFEITSDASTHIISSIDFRQKGYIRTQTRIYEMNCRYCRVTRPPTRTRCVWGRTHCTV